MNWRGRSSVSTTAPTGSARSAGSRWTGPCWRRTRRRAVAARTRRRVGAFRDGDGEADGDQADFFVSQKILSISRIESRSLSATATSLVRLA